MFFNFLVLDWRSDKILFFALWNSWIGIRLGLMRQLLNRNEIKLVYFGYKNLLGNLLVYDFWTPPPPINFVHAHIQHMDNKGHVAAAPGP